MSDLAPPPRQPFLNVDGVVLLLGLSILISPAVQIYLLPDQGYALALSSQALSEGRWWTLLTSILVHGGWLHAAMNAAAALSLGKAVRPFFAPGAGGAVMFLAFYLLCGLAGGLVFLAINPAGGAWGASGAIFGLWGAFARATPWPGVVGPLWSRHMRSQLVAVLVSNIVVIVAAGALLDGMGIAWEAHLGGFIAGVLLIGLFARRRSQDLDLPQAEN